MSNRPELQEAQVDPPDLLLHEIGMSPITGTPRRGERMVDVLKFTIATSVIFAIAGGLTAEAEFLFPQSFNISPSVIPDATTFHLASLPATIAISTIPGAIVGGLIDAVRGIKGLLGQAPDIR